MEPWPRKKTGDCLTAGLHYDQLGDLDKALDCYEKAGEYHLAGESFARQVQELNAGSSHYGAASHVAELARLSHRAGRCFEKAGDIREAANLLGDEKLSGGDAVAAADLFLKAGNKEKSAELYFEFGDFDLASLLFAQSNRFFDAAKSAAEANSETKMVEFLQQVPASDPNFPVAVVQLARAFVRRGWASLATSFAPCLRGRR